MAWQSLPPRLIAGLVGASAWVSVGPPLFTRAPSLGRDALQVAGPVSRRSVGDEVVVGLRGMSATPAPPHAPPALSATIEFAGAESPADDVDAPAGPGGVSGDGGVAEDEVRSAAPAIAAALRVAGYERGHGVPADRGVDDREDLVLVGALDRRRRARRPSSETVFPQTVDPQTRDGAAVA